MFDYCHPIHLAAGDNNLAEVMALLQEDPEALHVVDYIGCLALHHACQYGHVETATYLLDHGSNINQPESLSLSMGRTPLYMACWKSHVRVVEILLLDRGADPSYYL